MTTALLLGSWRAVRVTWLPLVATTTLVLLAVSWPLLDDGHALTVLRGVAVLLAGACLLSVDDPPGDVLAASPYPVLIRVGARILTGLPWVAAVWVAAIALVRFRSPEAPLVGISLEACSLILIGLAIAAGLQAWGGLVAPSHAACVGLVGLVVLGSFLPRWYAIHQTQSWGPPWEAAHIRWAALALAASALLHAALRDPLDRQRELVLGRRPSCRTRAGFGLCHVHRHRHPDQHRRAHPGRV